MISIAEIDKAIAEHERGDATYSNCERLAWLYIVRDHLAEDRGAHREESPKENHSQTHIEANEISDFLKAVKGKDERKIFTIMDELMQTIHVIQPRVYDAVMLKIKDL